MKDRVRVGVIGTSWYADFMHLAALKSHPQADIAAICGRSRERAEELARKHDIPRAFTDYRAMIDQGELDAVVVCTPDDLHYPMTMAALDAGLHVLCEKPLALTLAQAREMLAKAESTGVRHMIHFTHRWEPHNRYLLELTGDGYLGQPYHARFSFMGDYARGPGYHWRWDRRHALGALGDLGSHMIDLARLAFGEIARVHAHLLSHVDRPAPDGKPYDAANDSALLTVLFRNGAQGTIQASAVAQVWDQHVSLCGEAGALELDFDYDNPFAVRGARRDTEAYQALPIPEHLLGGIDAGCTGFDRISRIFTEQSVGARLFIDGIVQDKPIPPSFYDGMKAQAVIEAALESDRTGCWVDVG